MKSVFTIIIFILTACSSGISENAVQTAIAETREFEDKLATAIELTEKAKPTETPTKEPTPTSTPDPCSEEIIRNWFTKVRPIASEFSNEWIEFLGLMSDWIDGNATIYQSDLEAYQDNVFHRFEKLDLIDTPKCAEKALQNLINANIHFHDVVFYLEENDIVNVLSTAEKVIEAYSKYANEIKKLGLLDD